MASKQETYNTSKNNDLLNHVL